MRDGCSREVSTTKADKHSPSFGTSGIPNAAVAEDDENRQNRRVVVTPR